MFHISIWGLSPKPPVVTWTVASAVRESAVCLHRSVQHKGLWMSLSKLMPLIEPQTSV